MKPHYILVLIGACVLTGTPADAQTKYPPETRNAALRYWQAFAETQDSPADKATQELLEKVAAGQAAWDEEKLGAILDQNEAAILAMQRATRLPECDWGTEYSAGVRAVISYAPRARVLARLNTLYGLRMAAKGQSQKAVDAWLAGIKFSQDLTNGGSLVFALIGDSILIPDMQTLTKAAEMNTLMPEQRRQIERTIRRLPEAAFDWGEAMRIEEAGVYSFADQIAQAPNPAQYYASAMGGAISTNFAQPSLAERAAYHKLMLSVEAALREPPAAARGRLAELDKQIESLPWFFRQTTPKFSKSNDRRLEIAEAREKLLATLSTR